MTATQEATMKAALSIIDAPQKHLDMEPPECLLELIDVCLEHLDFMAVGVGWCIIRLKLLRDETVARCQMKLL